jgi:hypothetical protein
MNRIHELKTWPEYFNDVRSGRKTFELRLNDRDFQYGDTLVLKEFDPSTNRYTGDSIKRWISHISHPSDCLPIPSGYVILSLMTWHPVKWERARVNNQQVIHIQGEA